MKKCAFKICVLFICFFTVHSVHGQVIDSLDLMRQQFEKETSEMRAEFEAYEAKMREDFKRYVDSIKNVWGESNVVDNTKKVWVEYGKDYRSRSVVDFESGNIAVEITVEESEKQDSSLINKRLAAAIEQMLNSRGSTDLYQSTDGKSKPILERPALEGLVDLSMYDIDTASSMVENKPKSRRAAPLKPTVKGKELSINSRNNLQEVASNQNGNLAKKRGETNLNVEKRKKELEAEKKKKELEAEQRKKELEAAKKKAKVLNNAVVAKNVVSQSKKTTTTTKGVDGKERQIVKVEMALVSDRISKSAALYKDLVAEFSEAFNIDQPLIFAVIETESSFQPKAVSSAPAYGLMQLVPKYGGREAYRYAYKKDVIPTVEDLFNPRLNIQLGTAYLRCLMNQLAGITDEHCRRLCVIASYNTGTGNLAKAFIGTMSPKKAMPSINALNYDKLYNHLITKLPAQETRDYVVRVTQRREKYMKK